MEIGIPVAIFAATGMPRAQVYGAERNDSLPQCGGKRTAEF